MAGKTPREVLTLPEADPACALAPEHSLITQLALDDAAAQTDFVYRRPTRREEVRKVSTPAMSEPTSKLKLSNC